MSLQGIGVTYEVEGARRLVMIMSVAIFKEKKKKDSRMVILPSGRSKIGLIQSKDYGIISYLNREETKKLGEFVLWALVESDEKVIEKEAEVKWGKKYFNCSTDKKATSEYNYIDFDYDKKENKYELQLNMKDGYGYSPFQDMDGKECKHIFHEKPSAEELGKKVMEMFTFKEKYDGGVE